MARARVLFVSPIRPGLHGSGLAHRAGAWWRALSAVADVTTVVVPVADPAAVRAATDPRWRVATMPGEDERLSGALRAMAEPALRGVSAEFDVAVDQVAAAPAWWGAELAGDLATVPPVDAVVCFRSYLAPFVAGMMLRQPFSRSALVVDLDDDEVAFHSDRGDRTRAQAFARLEARLVERGAVLTAAGRHRLPVVALPNCVDLPPPAALRTPPAMPRALFVGNLTYAPNVAGLQWYVDEVHPLVRRRHPGHVLRVVGPGGERLAGPPGVEAAGMVDDLAAEYLAAQVAIAPILSGSGTRIKVVEAWAHRRPVVATTVGVDGLVHSAGHDVLVADDAAAFAAAVADLLGDPHRSAAVAAAGRERAEAHYSSAAFDSLVADLLSRALGT